MEFFVIADADLIGGTKHDSSITTAQESPRLAWTVSQHFALPLINFTLQPRFSICVMPKWKEHFLIAANI